jgi:protein-disulfide isomerase
MEKPDRNLARWVEDRLATLQPAADFRPNASQALARLQQRDRAYRVTRRRWFWGGGAAAAAVCLAVLAMPAPCNAASSTPCGRPIATSLWDSLFRKPAESAAPTVAFVPPAAVPPAPVPVPAAPGPAAPPPQPQPPVPYKQSGSPHAPITCEIYSDYECPHCAQTFLDVIPLLVAQYVETGKVKLVHRDFPLRQHLYAKLAARYANAAGRLGAYEVVVDQLYRTQSIWAQSGDIESQLAAVLSPTVLQQVRNLVKDPQFDDTIDADVVMALQDHIDRTPSLVVIFGGKRQVISGIPDFPLLKGYLDELLNRQ